MLIYVLDVNTISNALLLPFVPIKKVKIHNLNVNLSVNKKRATKKNSWKVISLAEHEIVWKNIINA